MKNFLLFLHILNLCVFAKKNEEEFCSIEKSENDCNKNDPKFQPEWNQYLKAIEEAEIKFSKEDKVCSSGEKCDGDFCYLDSIIENLRPFPKISLEDLNQVRKDVPNVVTYQFIDGVLYRSPKCLFPTRCDGIEHFLSKTSSTADFELTLNTHDWPHINKFMVDRPLPLFSFSKTTSYHDIAYPAWTFWAGGPATKLYPRGLGRWDLMKSELSKSLKENPWSEKSDKAFFRGSRTSHERDPLVLLSRSKPDLVDASYTKNQAWKSPKDTLGAEPASEVSLPAHCSYKYLFNYRGVAASFRYKHLFLCGSLVFNVIPNDPDKEWTEFFYYKLKPWIHYIPVTMNDEKSLQSLIEFAKAHEEKMSEIAERGRKFIEENLTMADVQCYWDKLIEEYAKRLTFKPVRNSDFIKISSR